MQSDGKTLRERIGTAGFVLPSVGAVWAYQRRGFDGRTAGVLSLARPTRPAGDVLFSLAVADALLARPRPDSAKRPPSSSRGLFAAPAAFRPTSST